MKYEIVSWDQSYQMSFRLFEKMIEDDFYPDVIVGIARGGWIPARLLADFNGNKRTANIKIEFYEHTSKSSEKPIISQEISEDVSNKKVLIVDDVADSGKSLAVAIDHIKKMNPKKIQTATLFYKDHSIIEPDYYVRETKAWVVYPWEYCEFIKYYNKSNKEEKSKNTIINELKDIGIPSSMVEAFFSFILSHEK